VAKKLGEELIRRGVITDDQLAMALNSQLVHGGHLGTCLIELEYIDEQQLGRVLAEIHGVKLATPEMLARVPELVLDCVPKQTVQKLNAIPFRFSDKTLHVAMVNPRDLQALGDLEFATGCRIEPWVAPEVRIRHAMEIYYALARSHRFIMLSSASNEFWDSHKPGGVPVAAADPVPSATTDSRSTAVTAAAGEPAVMIGGDLEPAIVALDNVIPHPGSAEELIGDLDAESSRRIEAPDPEPSRAEPPSESLADRLCRAETAEDVAEVVLDTAIHGMMRCLLFSVKAHVARIWHRKGFGLVNDDAMDARFGIASEPLFKLIEDRGFYRGPVPSSAGHDRLYTELATPAPEEILILPIHIKDQLVAVFYGDGGDHGSIRGETDDYRRLMTHAEAALQIVALKKKLRGL
jgi:hypothetical protein